MRLFKRVYFQVMSKIVSMFAKAVGPVHAPFTKKRLRFVDVLEIRDAIFPGDIILTRTHGELTTAIIPGFWKHAEVYVGDDRCVGAVSPKVREGYLADIAMRTDHVAVLRVIGIDPARANKLIEFARAQIGKGYDFSLNIQSKKEMYCSEIVFGAVNRAMGKGFVETRERMGFQAFTPDDVWGCAFKKSDPLFRVVYLSTDNASKLQELEALKAKPADLNT